MYFDNKILFSSDNKSINFINDKHFEAWMKQLPFCRWHFQMLSCERKSIFFLLLISIGSSKRWLGTNQATMTQSTDIFVSPGLNELNHCSPDHDAIWHQGSSSPSHHKHQATNWINVASLPIRPLRANFSEIWIKHKTCYQIHSFPKQWSFCPMLIRTFVQLGLCAENPLDGDITVSICYLCFKR